ncbi:MAG: hypothetical protein V9E94_10830 [Microthrixaceae bacterium]
MSSLTTAGHLMGFVFVLRPRQQWATKDSGSRRSLPRPIRARVCRTSSVPPIVIGHLVVQVWGGSGSGTTDLQRPGIVIAEAAMVWPPVPGPVSWPPRVPLTGFEA